MKRSMILLLLSALLCRAALANDEVPQVTSKVFEHDLNGGKTHVHAETFYRGKKRILTILRTTEGSVTKTSRGYEVGEFEAIESDEDGDGIFESLVLYNTKTKELEAFSRDRDNSVTPVDAKTLAIHKEQLLRITSFWDETLGKGAAPDKFLEAAKALKQKLSELEKQKSKDER